MRSGACRPQVGNLTAYQHLVGETASDILPAGFLHALAFPVSMSVMNRDDFPLPLLGMVHLGNEVEQHGPVLFTEALDITSWAENLRGHRAGTQVDIVAEVRGTGTPRSAGREPPPTWPKASSSPASTSPRHRPGRTVLSA